MHVHALWQDSCVDVCGCVVRWRAHLFHVSEYVSNKRRRRAACELLDYIRVLQIDCKRIIVSIGKRR